MITLKQIMNCNWNVSNEKKFNKKLGYFLSRNVMYFDGGHFIRLKIPEELNLLDRLMLAEYVYDLIDTDKEIDIFCDKKDLLIQIAYYIDTKIPEFYLKKLNDKSIDNLCGLEYKYETFQDAKKDFENRYDILKEKQCLDFCKIHKHVNFLEEDW